MDIATEFVDYFVMAIALLTDFGDADYFAGAMKGVILSINPMATIVDITHSIARHDVAQAAFCLGACFKDFPHGTIFLCVVDPGVGSARRGIAAFSGGKLFVAPDNGLLTYVLKEYPDSMVVELENSEYFATAVSGTFHGRDVFAPVAGHLSNGVEIGRFGAPVGNPVLLDYGKWERVGDEMIKGSIIHIDRFGNLVTNIPSSEFDGISALEIAGTRILVKAEFYAEAPAGTLFFIVGSAGYIEICIFGKSAAERLGSLVADPLHAHLKTVGSM